MAERRGDADRGGRRDRGRIDGADRRLRHGRTAGRADRGADPQRRKDLTVVNNNAGNGEVGLAALLASGQVRKIICSFPRQADS